MSRCPECGTKECCGASMSEELKRPRPVVEAARKIKIICDGLDDGSRKDPTHYLEDLYVAEDELCAAIRKLDGGG